MSILGATQIRKSYYSGLAILYLAAVHNRPCVIVSAVEKYAMFPMGYAIMHLNDNEIYRNKLLQGGEEKIDKLKAQESKKQLKFKDGGSIKVVTLNEKDSEDSRRAALGQGGATILWEEASLSSNDTDAMVYRMIAGWGRMGQIIKLGNAISREAYCDHFYKSTLGEDGFVNLTIDYRKAIEEGIYTQEFVDKAKKKPQFDQLYACLFPNPTGLVQGGYRRLFDVLMIHEAYERFMDSLIQPGERPVAGIDVGKGSPDATVIVMRYARVAFKVFTTLTKDTMAQIGEYAPVLERYNPIWVNIDGVGLGDGPASRLRELGFPVNVVMAGSAASEPGYRDIKAQCYFKAEQWVNEYQGAFSGEGFDELTEVAYKNTSDRNVHIESKEELQARSVPSYNVAEAFMLTFYQPEFDKKEAYGIPIMVGSANRFGRASYFALLYSMSVFRSGCHAAALYLQGRCFILDLTRRLLNLARNGRNMFYLMGSWLLVQMDSLKMGSRCPSFFCVRV